ncbi:GspH/FimT family pseudopilin [Pseudomonas sp. R5(2019)]|uniref:GspH/FimT family pseudopilin n=1 Tax=Pseudomonas sp. R5(2019) TaxID=2697566 RepID=UPI001412B275|nr:GspH/FimT family pseudopilin [Pseudomonas sp. R5(2019)]NBA96438.1 general secretion pathway protein GspH [Pseudomonas sp. R5(2019)]
MRKDCRGFSLVELLLVVIFITILATMVIPAYSGLIQRNRADAELSELTRALHYARLEAIDRGTSLRIAPATSGAAWNTELKAVTVADTATTLRVVPAMTSGATLNAGSITAIDFNNFGGLAAPSSALTLTYTLGTVTRTLTICLNGRIVQGGSC